MKAKSRFVQTNGWKGLAGAVLAAVGLAGTAGAKTPATAEEIVAALAASADQIGSLQLQVRSTNTNVDPAGKVLQSFKDQERFSFERSSGKIRHRRSNDDQLLDHGKGKMKRLVGGTVAEVAYARPIEQDVPAPLLYVLYPGYAMGLMDLTSVQVHGNHATVTGVPKESSPDQRGQTRREFDVDLHKNMVEAVRLYSRDGRLINELRMIGAQRSGEAWLPRQVILKVSTAKSTVTVAYALEAAEVNTLQPAAMELN